MALKPNLHLIDRIIRIFFGLFLIYIGYIDHTIIKNETISILIAIFGAINIVVALMNHCPLYRAIGLNTCKDKDGDKESST